MNVLFVGGKQETEEMQARFGTNSPVHYLLPNESITDFSAYDLIIDARLELDELYYPYWDIIYDYKHATNALILLGLNFETLASLRRYLTDEDLTRFARFNSLPTFINRPIWEIAVINNDAPQLLTNRLNQLGIDYRLVADRIGMVMPRIICMIINEAFYTLQEGTATQEDINLSMKMGVNYPHGPFEWLNILGISNVYNMLQKLYADTGEERYKICPLLKQRYLLAE
ncbi:MAG TPA: 3-hydroxyacyl-CoA dehydrogenase family protein [Chitinophagales bacterium]|nr:3-hydroxyacyl-CoA dehydrogenase family protein [Chitinophagales bacterium]HRK29143.1 3-hydroxyacyl-CoA dehydrogenase family protein [Chitinophagales bacterium]